MTEKCFDWLKRVGFCLYGIAFVFAVLFSGCRMSQAKRQKIDLNSQDYLFIKNTITEKVHTFSDDDVVGYAIESKYTFMKYAQSFPDINGKSFENASDEDRENFMHLLYESPEDFCSNYIGEKVKYSSASSIISNSEKSIFKALKQFNNEVKANKTVPRILLIVEMEKDTEDYIGYILLDNSDSKYDYMKEFI